MIGGTSVATARPRWPGATRECAPVERRAPASVVPLAEKSRLGGRMAAGEFVVSVEVDPPPGLSLEQGHRPASAPARRRRRRRSTSPTARARRRAWATWRSAPAWPADTGVEPMMHVCCRDRNFLGLVAHLLAPTSSACATWSSSPATRRRWATTRSPRRSTTSTRSASCAWWPASTAASIPAGKALGAATSFVWPRAPSPAPSTTSASCGASRTRSAAGAEVMMTQPVYDPADPRSLPRRRRPLGMPVMVGLLPLA